MKRGKDRFLFFFFFLQWICITDKNKQVSSIEVIVNYWFALIETALLMIFIAVLILFLFVSKHGDSTICAFAFIWKALVFKIQVGSMC